MKGTLIRDIFSMVNNLGKMLLLFINCNIICWWAFSGSFTSSSQRRKNAIRVVLEHVLSFNIMIEKSICIFSY